MAGSSKTPINITLERPSEGIEMMGAQLIADSLKKQVQNPFNLINTHDFIYRLGLDM